MASIASARALLRAAEERDVAGVTLALRRGARVDAKDAAHGETALHKAAARGDLALVETLLAAHASLDTVSRARWTPLGLAIRGGHVRVVATLVAAGANTKRVGGDGDEDAALTCAVRYGRWAVLDALLASDASLEDQSEPALTLASSLGLRNVVAKLLAAARERRAGWSYVAALTEAAERGHDAIVAQLVRAGADVDRGSEPNGLCPLLVATWGGHTAVVRVLLSAGANANATAHATSRDRTIRTGDSALMLVGSQGDDEILGLLLAAENVDVNHINVNGDTALLCAATTGRVDILDMLVAAGANVHHVNSRGTTALIRAMEWNSQADASMVERLLALGVAPDHADISGDTALIHASRRGDVAAVEMLLTTGRVDVKHTNSSGRPALVSAAWYSRAHVIDVLVAWGADVDECDRIGTTPIIAATDDVDAVVKLLAAGADANAANSRGYSPLLEAVARDRPRVVAALVAHDVDVNHQDRRGESALFLAQSRHRRGIANTLRALPGVDLDSERVASPPSELIIAS